MTAYFYITTKTNALMPREAAQLVTTDDFPKQDHQRSGAHHQRHP